MTDEMLQFEISQYLDGTLPEPQRAALENRLKSDPGAKKVFDEFRRINDLLDAALPVPDIDWDKMQRRISAAVAQTPTDEALAAASAEAASGWAHWKLWTSAALAATLLLVASAALLMWKRQGPSDMIAVSNPAPKPVIQVAVLTTRPPAGAAVSDIQIGQVRGVAAQYDVSYPEDLTVLESRVAIAGLPVLLDDEPMPIQ